MAPKEHKRTAEDGRRGVSTSAKALILLTFLHLTGPAAQAQGRTGIPEIDSLPLNDWRKPTAPLSYSKALTYSLLPGGGQFYGSHPVRGGFLVGLETLLGGLATYSLAVDIPRWRDQSGDALDSADALFLESLAKPDQRQKLALQRKGMVALARQRADLASRQVDLARSQAAWAAGLHAYGMMDAIEIAYLSRNPDGKTRSARSAMYRGMLFPGAGQLYNRRYGKFGMLWMALGASAVSAYSRQGMVEQLNHRLAVARVEAGPTSEEVGDLEKDRTLYRKRRNQYFWGMTLLYMYSIMDGMVDAALSDFDSPERFAFTAGPSGLLALEMKVPF